MAPLFFPLCKNIMYTSMLIMHAGLCCQDLHSGDYLAELRYHVCAVTLGPPNLVNSSFRKLRPLDFQRIPSW